MVDTPYAQQPVLKPAGSVSSIWLTPSWIYFGGSDTALQISAAPVNKQLIIVIVTPILFNERLLHFILVN